MAEIHKGQRWIESPPFLGRPLEAHVIIPTEIAINGEVTPRNQFIDEYLDGKHPRYQPIGFDALIFRAVNWNDYCNAISRRVLDEGGKVSPEQTDIFCNSPDIETVHTLGY